jgi:hypothetical protein
VGDVAARRELPRFEVILVVVGGRTKFFVIDHLTKQSTAPINPLSREQAEGLCGLMATNAREKGEQLTVNRLVSALSPPPQPKRERSPKQTNRHAPQARSH